MFRVLKRGLCHHHSLNRIKLPSPKNLNIQFEHAKKIDFEEKVTFHWNLICNKMMTTRSGYFMIDYPGQSIANEIIVLFGSHGYKAEFKKDGNVDYIVINDGI